MKEIFKPIQPGKVDLLPSLFQQRVDLNRRYLLSMRSENLLQNHYSAIDESFAVYFPVEENRS